MFLREYFLLALAIANASAAAVHVQPRHSEGTLTSFDENVTILRKMIEGPEDAETVDKYCKFPPKSVLHDLSKFSFFERCNRKFPIQLTPHTPDDDVLCMGLYKIGIQLCSFATKFSLPITSIPNDSSGFKELLDAPVKPDLKLCSEFDKLPTPPTQEIDGNDDWSTLRLFKKNHDICPRICFYLNGDENEFCKLILWSNRFMVDMSIKLNASPAEGTTVKAAEEQSQGISGIGVDKSSSEPINSPNLQVEGSSLAVSSRDSFSNLPHSSPKKIEAGKANADIVRNTMDSKHSAEKNAPINSSVAGAREVVHPNTNLAHNQSLPSLENEELTRKPNLSSVGQKIKPQKENISSAHAAEVISPDVQEEEKPLKQEKKVKAITAVPTSLLPESNPAIGQPDVIVQDTASNPSVEGNQETDEFTNIEPNLDQDEEEEMHYPALPNESPIKPDDNSINVDSEYQKPRGDDVKYVNERFEESEDSHFFRYFITMVVFCIFGYLLFHNKQKILALFLEGRSRRSSRRRPNTANYHKLDSNLEEAVSSPCNTSVAHVIY